MLVIILMPSSSDTVHIVNTKEPMYAHAMTLFAPVRKTALLIEHATARNSMVVIVTIDIHTFADILTINGMQNAGIISAL